MRSRRLLLFGRVHANRFQIFRFEDLPAVEAFQVVHAVPAGNNYGFIMFTSS